MTWTNVIGQHRVKKILQRALSENKVSHSYIFKGPEGIGKEATAIEFARSQNCDNPRTNGSDFHACGTCRSCKAIDNLSHPHIKLIFALPPDKSTDGKLEDPIAKLDSEQVKEIREQLIFKAKDNYYKIHINKAKQIKIGAIRFAKKELSMTDAEHGRRFILILDAHNMTNEAANAFLKTLEEPNDNITIILITSREEMMLPTILSRCQQIRFDLLDTKDIAEALIERYNINKDDAFLSASFAMGSFSKALEFLNEDMRQKRESIIALLRDSLRSKNYRMPLLDRIESFSKEYDESQHIGNLNLLLLWFKDTMRLYSAGHESELVNVDQIDALRKFAQRFGSKNIYKACEETEKAISNLKSNVSAQLTYLDLVVKLRRILI